MHIPDNYLSPSTCAVMAAAMVPVWAHAVRKVKETVPKEKTPLLGVGAAFSFLAMMFNVPLPGGTTGHAVGGTLLAILLGPDAACIAVTIALVIQAVIFGDGGVLAIGANCFNMAFVLPYLGYAVYRLLKGRVKSDGLAAGIGAYAGINAAAFCAAVEFGIQPLLFTDAAGQALYCPYGLGVSIPAMMAGHLTVFGAVEVIFTVALLAYVKRTSPGLVYEGKRTRRAPLFGLMAVLIAACPLGLLAAGTAWGEWGGEEMSGLVGYTPKGFSGGMDYSALMPDYSVGSLPAAAGYILSAVVGAAVLVILFKVIGSVRKDREHYGANAE